MRSPTMPTKYPLTALVYAVEAAREVAVRLKVRVRHLVVRRDSTPVDLGVLHEGVTVHPVIKQQNMLRGVQNGIAALKLAAVNTVANLLHVVGAVATVLSAALPRHRDHARAILPVPI
jgi:hypothetical protein